MCLPIESLAKLRACESGPGFPPVFHGQDAHATRGFASAPIAKFCARLRRYPAGFVWLALAGGLLVGCGPQTAPPRTAPVRRGPLEVWSVYEGVLEARREEPVMSQLPGAATLIELAPEGLRVQPGEVIARFDPSAYQHDVLRLERDYAMARAELEGLERARQPLELAQMAHEAREAEAEYQNERLFLEDNRLLAEEGLVSPQEVERQGLKVEQLRQRLEQQRERADLTAAFLHPAQLERARAEALAAEQALELARGRLAASTVRAPVAGLVVYVPTHLGGEYRAVRVGDPVYLNQVFLIIPDMGDLLAVCYVPEGDLNRVRVGHAARIAPVALPDLQIEATVEQVGLMAQNRPGAQSWQRVFRVRIALAEGHPDLRTGMTVQVRILAHRADDVLLAPRAAVFWEAGQAYVWRRAGRDFEAAPVELGWADAGHFEVRAGLAENTEVRLE